jgi:hypothetical protein
MIDALQEKHIDPQTLTYVGRVHGTHENSRAIHFVRSPEDLTYIAQCPYPNVVRFSRQQRMDAVKEIVGIYGIAVSGALRGLLEEKKK